MKHHLDQYGIAELIFREMKNELSERDRAILVHWKSSSPENLKLYHKIIDEKNIIKKISAYNEVNKAKAWDNLDLKLNSTEKTGNIRWLVAKYAVAASILLMAGSYLFLRHSPTPEVEKLATNTTIASGTQKARLTTANNTIIELGDVGRKRTFQLKKLSVVDTNNTLTFEKAATVFSQKSPDIAMNTLEIPRGGEYSLVLSDGTKVFLNAESKLIFPEIFPKDMREVTLEGEAYFDVSPSETKPFVVKTKNYDVKVYGTSFNVSAYASDKNSRTTLVEGSVGIRAETGAEIKLLPGEQVVYNEITNNFKTEKVDAQIYTSWKDGKFTFANEPLEAIMKKLERWYDVETIYLSEDVRKSHFSGVLDKYDDISPILKVIALTTHIEFKIERKVVYVDKKE